MQRFLNRHAEEPLHNFHKGCCKSIRLAHTCASATSTTHHLICCLCHAKTGLTRRMGTHPSGPATVEGAEGQSLSSWIEANPSVLGAIGPLFGDIPFLFKVSMYSIPQLA